MCIRDRPWSACSARCSSWPSRPAAARSRSLLPPASRASPTTAGRWRIWWPRPPPPCTRPGPQARAGSPSTLARRGAERRHVAARVEILAVGSLHRDLEPAAHHFIDLLRPHATVSVREVKEVTLRGRSEAEVLREEGRRLLAAVSYTHLRAHETVLD